MFTTGLLQIGWRPVLAGSVTLIVGAIAGFGLAGEATFAPARWVGWWLDRVVIPILRDRRGTVRTVSLFVNNAILAAAMIAAGGLPGGSWVAVVVVGLFMGTALRWLGDGVPLEAVSQATPKSVDSWVRLGLVLNVVEFPALGVAVGLSLGQRAAPNGLATSDVWILYRLWVVPALLMAAIGESIWIGRLHPFKPDDS